MVHREDRLNKQPADYPPSWSFSTSGKSWQIWLKMCLEDSPDMNRICSGKMLADVVLCVSCSFLAPFHIHWLLLLHHRMSLHDVFLPESLSQNGNSETRHSRFAGLAGVERLLLWPAKHQSV